MLKFGYITELKMETGQARVYFPDLDIVSNFLAISVPASKDDKYSFPFAVNEQVWCVMDDHCEFGVIGGAVYSQKDNPPSNASDKNVVINLNGKITLDFDRQTGRVKIESSGNIELETAGAEVKISSTKATILSPVVEITGNLTVAGTVAAGGFTGSGDSAMIANTGIEANGDITLDGLSLKTHKHISSSPGNPTSPPIL